MVILCKHFFPYSSYLLSKHANICDKNSLCFIIKYKFVKFRRLCVKLKYEDAVLVKKPFNWPLRLLYLLYNFSHLLFIPFEGNHDRLYCVQRRYIFKSEHTFTH